MVPASTSSPRLLAQVRTACAVRRYSSRTTEVYVEWVRRFVHHCRAGSLVELQAMGAAEVTAFLADLAEARQVSASTQSQARAALQFLWREVLGLPATWFDAVPRAAVPQVEAPVLSPEQVQALLVNLGRGATALVARLIYGTGLRLAEACTLRVRDINLTSRAITVRCGKGGHDRLVVLPVSLVGPLRAQLIWRREQLETDRGQGGVDVELPGALSDCHPGAAQAWAWQFVFTTGSAGDVQPGGAIRRHHIAARQVQRTIQRAAAAAGIHGQASPHTLRHSYATHSLAAGVDIRTLQQLLGHTQVATTQRYTHVQQLHQVVSPLDLLPVPHGS